MFRAEWWTRSRLPFSVSTWPLCRSKGPLPLIYDAAFWSAACPRSAPKRRLVLPPPRRLESAFGAVLEAGVGRDAALSARGRCLRRGARCHASRHQEGRGCCRQGPGAVVAGAVRRQPSEAGVVAKRHRGGRSKAGINREILKNRIIVKNMCSLIILGTQAATHASPPPAAVLNAKLP